MKVGYGENRTPAMPRKLPVTNGGSGDAHLDVGQQLVAHWIFAAIVDRKTALCSAIDCKISSGFVTTLHNSTSSAAVRFNHVTYSAIYGGKDS